MKEKDYIIKNWKLCSLICFAMAFWSSFMVFGLEQISLIMGNSYYLSSFSIFLKTILWPVQYCFLYAIVTEIICQLLFWVSFLFMSKEKRKQKNLAYAIIISIISCVLSYSSMIFLIAQSIISRG